MSGLNILFIGNNYTYVHKLPGLFEKPTKENGKDVSVDSVTEGSRKLYENLQLDTNIYKKYPPL